jgi:flagellar biosynthesis chaperone FliJ
MSSPSAVREAEALLRLRLMREDAARVSMERCREREAACRRVVEQRQAQIARVRQSRLEMVEWLSDTGTADVPRTWPYAAARLTALEDELERAEVELIDERDELKAATQELQAARAAWVRESARRQAVEQLAADARLDLARGREQRAEREIEPRRLPEAWQGA